MEDENLNFYCPLCGQTQLSRPVMGEDVIITVEQMRFALALFASHMANFHWDEVARRVAVRGG